MSSASDRALRRNFKWRSVSDVIWIVVEVGKVRWERPLPELRFWGKCDFVWRMWVCMASLVERGCQVKAAWTVGLVEFGFV